MQPTNRYFVQLHREPGLVSRLIRWQQRGTYSHVSLLLPDGTVWEARPGAGVRAVHVSTFEAQYRAGTIDIAHVDLVPWQEWELLRFLEAQLGKPYDYLSVLRFVTRRKAGSSTDSRWFCSEFCYAALQYVGIELFHETEAWEVSPAWIARSPLLTFL